MIDTIIFDMDGVIVDSELYWKKSEFDFIKKMIPELDDKTIAEWIQDHVLSRIIGGE